MSNAIRNLLVQMTGQDPKALGLPEEGTAGFMDSRPATVHFLSLLNQLLKLYQTHQISYPQLLQTWNSLQFFRIDQSDDTLDRLVSPGQPNPGFLTPDMLDKLAPA
ncbi:MAG: hypothetical protein IPP67_03315 [Rhodospirillaceae bacterium]|nr:hypothetical protein [Rhodospirillaceae bacterium]